jgi:hypothetical protein
VADSPFQNLLDAVATPLVPHEEVEGMVVLLIPRLGNPWIRALFGWLNPKPVKLRLAGLGSATWRAMDGKRTLAEVADAVRVVEGEQEKLSERVAIFVRELAGQRLVKLTLRAPKATDGESAAG